MRDTARTRFEATEGLSGGSRALTRNSAENASGGLRAAPRRGLDFCWRIELDVSAMTETAHPEPAPPPHAGCVEEGHSARR
ncbi:MAG: hypothetical protein ABSG93_01185 [Solirubrobacteraceae bacterium]